MHGRLGAVASFVVVGALALASPGRVGFAQTTAAPPTPPGTPPQVPLLALGVDHAFQNGRVAAVKGTVTGEGLRFAVGSLSILQPVVVALFAGEPGDHLELTLFKKDWSQPRREGTTGTAGSVAFTFRTEGGVNIQVRSSGPSRPFTLAAWAGDEVRPSSMKPVIVTPAQFKGAAVRSGDVEGTGTALPGSAGQHSAGQTLPAAASQPLTASRLGWVVAGALGLGVIVLGALVLRRPRK